MKKSIIVISLIFYLFSCNVGDTNENKIQNKNPVIYTSFYPIYFITKEIVWNWSNVINIVPNLWEPHEYEPTVKQIEWLINSDFIVFNGLWIESYQKKLLISLKKTPYIILWEQLKNTISLEEWEKNEHWNIDPHTWLSPKTYSQMASVLFLEIEKNWFKNLDKSIIEQLNNLDKKYSENLAKCKRKEFVTSHKAFWYLARDYWLIQTAVLWISPEEEPSANDIANVVELIKSKSIPVIYSEKLVSPKFTNVVIKETWAKVLELNPLETITPEEEKAWENYISIMEDNLEKLLEWLDCK